VARLLNELRPALVVAGYLGDGKGLDVGLLTAARSLGIPTLGVLDSWTNLDDRHLIAGDGRPEGPGGAFFPDMLAVMDEDTRGHFIRLGASPSRVVVTGQPAFDDLSPLMALRPATRRMLKLEESCVSVAFFSEPLRELGTALGFDQHAALAMLLEAVGRCEGHFTILHRVHPVLEGPTKPQQGRNYCMRCTNGLALADEVLAAADIVCGVSSTLLVKAYLAGKQVIVLRPGAPCEPDPCPLVTRGLVAPARTPADVARHLQSPLQPTGPRDFPHAGRATANILALIASVRSWGPPPGG